MICNFDIANYVVTSSVVHIMQNVRKEDQDLYHCYVYNKFGSESAPGKLIVVGEFCCFLQMQNT